MAVDIRNIANRNGIYYFRCRIPSNLTNGQYREVKISLNTKCFDAHLFEILEKANNYLRQVSLEYLQKSGINSKLQDVHISLSPDVSHLAAKYKHLQTPCKVHPIRDIFAV